MPVDADDDDVPESPITRIRRNWQGVCSAIQRRRGVAPSSDIEGDAETKDGKVLDEKDPNVSGLVISWDIDTDSGADRISSTAPRLL